MSAVDDQMLELTTQINRLVNIFHAGNSPYSSAGTSKTKFQTHQHASRGGIPGVAALSTAVKVMHGGADNFTYHIGRMSEAFAGLGVAVELFKGALDVGKSFSKMTDIGQNFNGSMTEMMRQVGQSGLSLDQFSAFLSRNSTLSAVYTSSVENNTKELDKNSAHQTGLTKKTGGSLLDLQLAVRDNIENMGFYGMSLAGVTEATSDYADTLRKDGLLQTMTQDQQAKAVGGLIKNTTGLAQLFGTSREQILKTTNSAMQQANYAAHMMLSGNKDVQEAGQKWISFYAALPGGDKLANAFAEQMGRGGFVDTDVGNTNIDLGLGKLNQIMQRGIDQANAGNNATPEDMARSANDYYSTLRDQIPRLQMLAKDPEFRAKANEKIDEFMAVQGKYFDKEGHFLEAQFAQKMTDEKDQRDAIKGVTKNMLLFESAFHKVTGTFLSTFWEAIGSALGGDENSAKFKNMMTQLQASLGKVGTALGSFIGNLLQPENIDAFFTVIGDLASVAGTLVDMFNKLSNTVKKSLEFVGVGKSTASVISVIAPLVMLWALKNAAFKRLAGGSLAGAAGAVEGFAAGAGNRATTTTVLTAAEAQAAAATAATKSRVQLGRTGKFLASAAGAYMFEGASDWTLQHLPDSLGNKKEIIEWGNGAAALIGMAFAPKLTEGLLTLGAKALAMLIPEALAAAVAGAAIPAAVGLGVTATAAVGGYAASRTAKKTGDAMEELNAMGVTKATPNIDPEAAGASTGYYTDDGYLTNDDIHKKWLEYKKQHPEAKTLSEQQETKPTADKPASDEKTDTPTPAAPTANTTPNVVAETPNTTPPAPPAVTPQAPQANEGVLGWFKNMFSSGPDLHQQISDLDAKPADPRPIIHTLNGRVLTDPNEIAEQDRNVNDTIKYNRQRIGSPRFRRQDDVGDQLRALDAQKKDLTLKLGADKEKNDQAAEVFDNNQMRTINEQILALTAKQTQLLQDIANGQKANLLAVPFN